ncbi:hypothetical protein, partial [Nocardioides sp. Leaf374]|uniref:hypothetical protein n=1 Tax=Nocardioides sp. Leaf374 TaxID=2876560 RepID=UPI001E5A9DCE
MHPDFSSPPAARPRTSGAPVPPRRPTLRPGLVVATREAGRLQVGLDEPRRVVLPDHPDVRRLLAALRDRTPPTPTTPEGVRALTALVGAGLVVDADLLDAAGAGTCSTTSRTTTRERVDGVGGDPGDVVVHRLGRQHHRL